MPPPAAEAFPAPVEGPPRKLKTLLTSPALDGAAAAGAAAVLLLLKKEKEEERASAPGAAAGAGAALRKLKAELPPPGTAGALDTASPLQV